MNLLAAGLIGHDPLAPGIKARPTGEVLRADGSALGWLFSLGAPLKGIVWESTAGPEIRLPAAEVARRILAVPAGTFPIPSECARAPDRASQRSPAS